MCYRNFFLSLLLFSYIQLYSQKIDLNDRFHLLLEETQMEFLKPLDAGYKKSWITKNTIQNYDFAIRSKREKLEIRYLIEPYQANNPSFAAPHIRCMQKVLSIASNDQNVVMTGLDIDPSQLANDFNADWGKLFFFKPKAQFCNYQNVQMLALFKEGQGMAYVFFLFNQAERALDNRLIALRYKN